MKGNVDGRTYKRLWWQYGRRSAKLDNLTRGKKRLLVISRVSPHLSIALVPNKYLFSETLIVFCLSDLASFAALKSRLHETWARFFSSTFGDGLRYAPSDCFATFPFPTGFETDATLEAIGQAYHDRRAALMVARNEGLTKTYNRFHDRKEKSADIQKLRELHAEMDRAVLHAYGWDDLADRAAPVFLDESNEDEFAYQGRLFWPADFRDEVLARLLALNAERHAEEVRQGLAAPTAEADEDEEDAELEEAD